MIVFSMLFQISCWGRSVSECIRLLHPLCNFIALFHTLPAHALWPRLRWSFILWQRDLMSWAIKVKCISVRQFVELFLTFTASVMVHHDVAIRAEGAAAITVVEILRIPLMGMQQ